MSYRNYCKEKHNSNLDDANTPTPTEKLIGDTYSKYSKMPHDEAMQALFNAVNREKASGVFNIDNIKAFYREVAPMLGNEERERMRAIIDAINK